MVNCLLLLLLSAALCGPWPHAAGTPGAGDPTDMPHPFGTLDNPPRISDPLRTQAPLETPNPSGTADPHPGISDPLRTQAPLETPNPSGTADPHPGISDPLRTQELSVACEPSDSGDSRRIGDPLRTHKPLETADPSDTGDSRRIGDPLRTHKPLETADPSDSGDTRRIGDPLRTHKPLETADPSDTGDTRRIGDPLRTHKPLETADPSGRRNTPRIGDPLRTHKPLETADPSGRRNTPGIGDPLSTHNSLVTPHPTGTGDTSKTHKPSVNPHVRDPPGDGSGIHRKPVFSTKTAYNWLKPDASQYFGTEPGWQSVVKHKGRTCRAIYVNAVLRHGSRYPGDGDIATLFNIEHLLKTLNHTEGLNDSLLQTLHQWKTPFTEQDAGLLLGLGAHEHFEMGFDFARVFEETLLQNGDHMPINFISSSKQRCRDSLSSFKDGMKGYLKGHRATAKGSRFGYDEPEFDKAAQQSIDDFLLRFFDECPKYQKMVRNKPAFEYQQFFKGAHMSRVVSRVHRRFGLNASFFRTEDVRVMYVGCAVEQCLANISHLCQLFDDSDFEVLEFLGDLKHYWTRSYGNQINYKQSCPLIKDIFEEIQSSVGSHIAGERYSVGKLMFGHAETLAPLYSTLGLFKDPHVLKADNYEQLSRRRFRTSFILPFAANIAIVVYHCGTEGDPEAGADNQQTFESREDNLRSSEAVTESEQISLSAAEYQRTFEAAAENQQTSEAAAENQRTSEAAAENQRTSEAAVENQRTFEAAAENQRTSEAAAENQRTSEAAAENQRTSEAAAENQRTSEAAAENRRTFEAAAENQRTTQSAAEEEENGEEASEARGDNRGSSRGSRWLPQRALLDGYVVRVYVNKHPVALSGCGVTCPLETFLARYDAVRDCDFDRICLLNSTSKVEL